MEVSSFETVEAEFIRTQEKVYRTDDFLTKNEFQTSISEVGNFANNIECIFQQGGKKSERLDVRK